MYQKVRQTRTFKDIAKITYFLILQTIKKEHWLRHNYQCSHINTLKQIKTYIKVLIVLNYNLMFSLTQRIKTNY